MNKVVVVGLGSMGRRRIRLMRSLPDAPCIVGVDTSEARRRQSEDEFGIDTTASLGEVSAAVGFDAAFVCTSPGGHEAVVMQCLEAGLHDFMEINHAGDWSGRAESLAAQKGLKLFISSTFLYHPQINYIIDAVKGATVDYIYHSGQYLPDWHPWESYKDFFVAEKRTNACREILAIELPWIVKAFGEVDSLHVMKDKNSSLEIDFPDNFMIALRHKNGNKGVFCQDIISRKGMRGLEVYSEDIHLFWDGRAHQLKRYDIGKKTVCPVDVREPWAQDAQAMPEYFENVYREEVRNFFDFISGIAPSQHSLAADTYVLDLIDKIEEAH